ncbi:MAG: hypothetical protein RMJ84_04815 [Sandaracinaceae bacterium]|nr:hypothetical protein [Sandaracinaceae bacterium]
MITHAKDRTLFARVEEKEGKWVLSAPCPGILRDARRKGELLKPGFSCGRLEVLGVLYTLIVPEGVHGIVVDEGIHQDLRRRPVAYGDPIATIDPSKDFWADEKVTPREGEKRVDAIVWRSPIGGRFYGRPSPQAPPFIEKGAWIAKGQTIGLIEVMKTFHRLIYGGEGFPERARVIQVLVQDGDDVSEGQALVELEREA